MHDDRTFVRWRAREVPGGLGQIRPERLLAAAIRQNRVGRREDHASDITPEVAELQEAYNIGTVDWAIIDASGMAEATLRDCRTRIDGLRTSELSNPE
jgi:hypothetical protein